jgi:hypothetical protein
VVGGTVEEPRVGYLERPLEVTEETLALAAPVKPTEVFRFAAPCAASQCQHFDGSQCVLATRTVALLPRVVGRLPRCAIRPRCRWWAQEGPAACFRCPQIVTEYSGASATVRQAATPNEREPTIT